MRLNIGPGARVLDLGCGAGDVSMLVAELVGPTGRVIGKPSPSGHDSVFLLQQAEMSCRASYGFREIGQG